MWTFRLFASCLLCCFLLSGSAQLYPVSLEARIAVSSQVIEGKVIAQRSLWDDAQSNIYTINTIAVAKVFKGDTSQEFIEVLTRGGTVGLIKEEVSHSLSLDMHDYGLFTLKSSPLQFRGHGQTYFAQGGQQGLVLYNTTDSGAKEVFETYENVETDLYGRCSKAIGKSPTPIQNIDFKGGTNPSQAKSITSISPAAQTAGTKSTITISGSSFEAAQGEVWFANADFGGNGFSPGLASEILAWSNTQIIVEVPDFAGTGLVRVETASGAVFFSGSSLQVDYAQSTVSATPNGAPGPLTYRTRFVNSSPTTGYVWQLNNAFAANTAAAAAFERAMDTWVENTCVNWEMGSNTSVDSVRNDDVNVVLFDEPAALLGAIGRCTSRFSGCFGPNGLTWYIEELDIVFDETVNWHFGVAAPPSGATDFESVAAHELGHGHQLGHVIAPGDLMHYLILVGSMNRTPSVNEVAGATDVMNRSLGSSVCGQPSCTESSSCSADDADNDGITDSQDNCPNTANPDQEDLDDDGEGDVCDSDIDGDGVANGSDCDPTDATLFEGASCNDGDNDTENDVILADCSCAGTLIDADNDGVTDSQDNCPNTTNPSQNDLDDDGEGDVCDSDIDGDGVANGSDCDPTDAMLFEGASCNDGDNDTENDVILADCSCAGTLIDADNDGVTDSQDNCPNDANPNQDDLDTDGEGDVCDADIDGDGVDNENDCEPLNADVSDCGCPGDLNGDGMVNTTDFLEFNTLFGTSCTGCPADISGDGLINTTDFLEFNTLFGTSCD